MKGAWVMKRFITIILLFAISIVLSAEQKKESPSEKKLKVGFYVDEGSRGGGVPKIARLLEFSPQLELVMLDGKDLREGALSKLDLLVMPGGSSQKQYESMQEAGAQAIRDFVSAGGSYLGVCAGFHCAMNRPQRVKLLPYGKEGSAGYQGPASVDVSAEGAKLLGIPAQRYLCHYSMGPISFKENDWEHSKAQTLAVYKSTITKGGEKTNKMFNAPAIIYGNHGKGKVVATSFHPEVFQGTYPIFFGCLKLVTGVAAKPVFPAKNFRPVRVGFYAASLRGKKYLPVWFALDKHADIDAMTVTTRELDTGLLNHRDILVIPPGNADVIRVPLKKRAWLLKCFMDQGGYILCTDEIKDVISHKNVVVVPENECFAKYVIKVSTERSGK